MLSARLIPMLGVFLCIASLAIAYFYMEKYLLLAPCPLCILDRLAVAAMAAVWALQSALPHWRRRFLTATNALFLSLGFVFAFRHIWLQNKPPNESAGCLADSEAAKDLIDVVARAFDASGDCGAIYWQFAGLSIPEQVLLLFIVFAALLGVQVVQIFRVKPECNQNAHTPDDHAGQVATNPVADAKQR